MSNRSRARRGRPLGGQTQSSQTEPQGQQRGGSPASSPSLNHASIPQVSSLSQWMEWHNKLGHVDVRAVRETFKAMDITYVSIPSAFDCQSCLETKISRSSGFDNATSHAFDIIVCGIIGPTSTPSMDDNHYIATFQDVHTRYVWVVPLTRKEDIGTALSAWLKSIKRNHFCAPKAFRSDNNEVFTSQRISDILRGRGITHQMTADESPQNNGLSKRLSRSLIDMVRPMLMESNSDGHLWEYAVKHAAWIRNRTHTTSVNGIPYTLLYGRKPDLSHVKPFGTAAQIRPYGNCYWVPGGGACLAIVVGMGDISPMAYKCIDPNYDWEMKVTADIIFYSPRRTLAHSYWTARDYATLFEPQECYI